MRQALKAQAQAYWSEVDAADPSAIGSICAEHLAQDVTWQGFAPLQDATGPVALAQTYLSPLKSAFEELTRETHILMAGPSDGRIEAGTDGTHWVGATGYFHGRQTQALWGIPATGAPLRLRWGEFLQIKDGQIVRIQTLIDVIDWLEQIGLSPLPNPRGAPFVYPAPTGLSGIIGDTDETGNEAMLAYGRQFIFGGLNAFDQNDLTSMKMADYFHPNLKWYGPGGIGACLSFKEFEDLHQRPWLTAFPDRRVGDLDNLIAEGDFVGCSSLPGVHLTHTGPYLGHAPSGARAGVNGIDFWRYENGQFTENWVFVDMVHLFAQFGIDLMAKVAHMAEGRR